MFILGQHHQTCGHSALELMPGGLKHYCTIKPSLGRYEEEESKIGADISVPGNTFSSCTRQSFAPTQHPSLLLGPQRNYGCLKGEAGKDDGDLNDRRLPVVGSDGTIYPRCLRRLSNS